MKNSPNLRALKFKQPDPNGIFYHDNDGLYRVVTPKGVRLTVIASDLLGWDHVSVSLPNRCPTWEEMTFVKDLFWNPDECVMQLHVPASDHKNLHPYCLHLWRPQAGEIPRPPSIMVA